MSEIRFTVKPLKAEDRGFVLTTMREGVKQNPSYDRVPWSYMKATIGVELANIINDDATKILGAYTPEGLLLGWVCASPSKRVTVVHWVYTRFEHKGERLRRRGIMLALLEDVADNKPIVYTLRARRCNDVLANGEKAKSLDNVLAEQLLARGITTSYVSLKEWLS